jgi:hypothetical protein
MTVLTRGCGARRGGRRPGWPLLTALLVLAIAASSALVFSNSVELLKLAVILSLWAVVAAAFVSVIYRRQSDIDQARARDLKLVYDLQLDREISARREYELTVETQLRRELAAELKAQAADEVVRLRAELTALRANLEVLFDADLSQRPALETQRPVHAYSDWACASEPAGRVTASRIDAESRDSPIIDVPEEPSALIEEPEPGGQLIPTGMPGGNWVENGSSAEYVDSTRAAEPAMSVRGRHSAAPDANDPGRPSPPPTLADKPERPPEPPADGQHTGGHSVAELLARLQVGSTGAGHRRRRED